MIKRLLFTLLLFVSFMQLKAVVCLPEWKYKRTITVTNANASAYTNFQVKVVLNTAALVSAGKMNINGDDIRFTDASCSKLNYWIDSNMNTSTTVIWVKLKTLPASSSSTINMYYGNLCATALQNGDSTFNFFDDFLGTTLNTTKWTKYNQNTAAGALSISGGNANFNLTTATDLIIRTNATFTGLTRSEMKVKWNSGSFPTIAQLNSTTFAGVTLGSNGSFFFNNQTSASCNSYTATTTPSASAKSNGVWGITWPATNSSIGSFTAGSISNSTTPSLAASTHTALGLMCSSAGSLLVDWCRVRTYAPVEPSTTVNAETTQGISITLSPNPVCPGGKLTISFTKTGVFFSAGNIFKLQLSDASGNFTTPLTLATITDTVLNTMIVDIPSTSVAGSGYKVRLTSTNPTYTCFSPSGNLTINPKPNVSFNVLNDNQCFKNNRYNFTSTSTISAGSISSYIWSWDDGSKKDTLTTANASHKFNVFYPYYYPKLTVVSNLGCKDSTSKQINIKESPNVRSKFNDTIQCYRGNFYIAETVTTLFSGMVTSISWNFGDGTPTVNMVDSLTHRYSAPGTYNVRQINQHSSGCIDTNYLSVLVNVHPVSKFTINDSSQCFNGNRYIYQAQSTISNGLPLINYWNLGSGITRDQQDSAQCSYSNWGNRNIRLITISDDGVDGCSDTLTKTIEVNPMPIASIQNLDLSKCFKYNSFRFIAKSTIPNGSMTHNWNFGDLSTLNNKDTVSHTYNTDGSFTIKVYSTSNKGCQDSTTTSVTVNPSPEPFFVINKDTQCFKYNAFKAVSLTAINSGTFTTSWKVSDGTSYTDVDSILHSFITDGNFTIAMYANSNNNCKDTIIKSVKVLPMPTSDFSINDLDQCLEGNQFTFTDNSTFNFGNLIANQWLFDDGQISNNQSSVNHSYLSDNAFRPGLIVYADNGCFDTSFQDIKVYPHPGSDFTINNAGQCVNNNNFVFTNATFIAEGGFTNRWYFGDGSPFVSTLSASKKYTKDSTYVVTVISISDQGCTDTAKKSVIVYPKAKTNFSINNSQQCVLGNKFTFTSSTTVKYGSYTLNWQFGDGNTAGNLNSVNHTYNNVQLYNVKLYTATDKNCFDTLTKPIRTLPMPNADFTYNYNEKCIKGNDFQFGTTSTVSNNTPMNHNWYYGDGDSTINNAFGQHTYKTDGAFIVRMISSTNIGGCKDTMQKTFNVYPMPVAGFNIDNNQQCFKNHVFNLNSTSTVSSGTIDITDWTFGDNTTSSNASPSKSYLNVDSFRVRLFVSTNHGCTDSIAKKVYIFPMPVAAFNVSPSSSCFKGNVFKITNKSSIVKGNITNYSFMYGNGDSSNLQNPAPYSYQTDGFYTLFLTTITDHGCWDTTSRNITINPNPVLDFTVDPVCLKDSSEFVNLSTLSSGNIASWKWLLGNGKVALTQSPKHKYKNVGNYNVTLIAVTDKGCVDTIVKPGIAVVNPNPKAGFYYSKLRSWENEVDIQYTDTSSGAISWKWNFASMGSSSDQNPKLFYTDTLTQLTSLIVTNAYGCKDTSTKLLFITPDVTYYMPNAFTPNDDNINETYKPVGLSYAINYKFIIFNRWGEILFKSDNPQIGWNGKYENELVPQDLYFYRLEFIGVDEIRHEETGHVMILK